MSGTIDLSSYNYRHGIVSQDCFAQEYSDAGISIKLLTSGTFVQVQAVRDEDVVFFVVGDDMDLEPNKMLCKKADIIKVSENLWESLIPLGKSARLSLVKESKIAEAVGRISMGETVQVLGPDHSVICIGNVVFRNYIETLGVGVYFGVQVLSSRENLQAIRQEVSLMRPGAKGFPRGCDIVVTVDKILPTNYGSSKDKSGCFYEKEYKKPIVKSFSIGEDVSDGSFKSVISYNLKEKHSGSCKKEESANRPDPENVTNHSRPKKKINPENPLNVGDEVIFMHGDVPEKGLVRWIGLIENSVKVEVEFDDPIRTGTADGLCELLRGKYDHTFIVPPTALIKLSEYLMNISKEEFHTGKNTTAATTANNNNNHNVNHNNNNSSSNINSNTGNNNNINNNNNNNSNNNKNNSNGNVKGNYYPKTNISIKNNNNNNNVNNNDDCCRSYEFDGKQNIEDGYKRSKKISVSHQFLKHPEKNFEANDYFTALSKDDVFAAKDSVKGVDQERSHRGYVCIGGKKSQNSSVGGEDDFILYESTGAYSAEKNWKSFYEKEQSFLAKQSSREEKTDTDLVYDVPPSAVRRVSTGEVLPPCCRKPARCTHEKDAWSAQRPDNLDDCEENLAGHCDPFRSSGYYPDDLGKGSVVELTFRGDPHYGVIRWIGTLPEDREAGGRLTAGVEMEEEHPEFTDGTWNNKRYFRCNSRKALFLPLTRCRKDSRFLYESQKQSSSPRINCGQMDCPVVEGTIPPINRKGDIESICGKNRGIQGHHNSCYLDATLFSMFAFTSVFDSLLYRPPTKNDIPQYSEVQRVLREEIVNPLRKNLYVRADRVMKLRTLLEKLSSVSGLTSEEKDPEEFLNSLLAQILKAEPFLKLSSGQEAFHYQLFVEKDERLVLPSVQQLFEQSFLTSDIKLKQVPSCLIIQMPRFGKSFKMYSRILPPQLLDITDVIENSPRQCTVCGKLAAYECKDCFGQQGIGNGLESISFCKMCSDTVHNHHCRNRHDSRALTVPEEFYELQEHCVIPRLYMELFAVVCIETSHYVAFVKCGSGSDAPWCFFDSMADRKGEQNGYNIPEMVPCPDLPYWLSEDGAKTLNEMRDERQLTEHAKRLFSDAYMCMYQSPDLMMYR